MILVEAHPKTLSTVRGLFRKMGRIEHSFFSDGQLAAGYEWFAAFGKMFNHSLPPLEQRVFMCRFGGQVMQLARIARQIEELFSAVVCVVDIFIFAVCQGVPVVLVVAHRMLQIDERPPVFRISANQLQQAFTVKIIRNRRSGGVEKRRQHIAQFGWHSVLPR